MDGSSFIRSGQAEAGGGTPSNMIVVLNWTEELKRLVPGIERLAPAPSSAYVSVPGLLLCSRPVLT